MGLLPLPSSCLHPSLYLLWVMQGRENGDLWVCQESKGGLQQDMLFPRVNFRNDEQEGLGMTGCPKIITVGWVSLGSPSGNSRPLLQENQMAKGDSLDSMCWNCTEIVWEGSGMERERDNLLTILKLSWMVFFIVMKLLCFLNLCSQLLLFLIHSSFQHKVKATLWVGHWLMWPRKAWSLPGCTCHSSGKDFSLGFFQFVSVML